MISVDYSITMEKDAKNKPKAEDRKLHILKQDKRISSGRITKPPKRIMSTSSDQNHRKKLPKLSQPAVNMRSAINEPSLDTKKHSFLVKNVRLLLAEVPLQWIGNCLFNPWCIVAGTACRRTG